MKKENITYYHGEQKLHGELILPEGDKPHPVIMVVHAWKGKDAFARSRAEEITVNLGIGTFVCDLYGLEFPVESNEEAEKQMIPLFKDRKTLRGRMAAAYNALFDHTLVVKEKIGAIGFCFGGLAVIELFKSGVPVKGVVAFHPLFGDKIGHLKADLEPIAKGIEGSILAITGHLDPLVTQDDLNFFKKEMTEAGVDWQLHIYGRVYHAFTNPQEHNKEAGLVYDPLANKRSWNSMANFFSNLL